MEGGCDVTHHKCPSPGVACLAKYLSAGSIKPGMCQIHPWPSTFSSSRTIQRGVRSQVSPTAVFGCIVSEQGMLIQTSALHLDLPLIPDMLKGENKFILAKQEVKFLITIVREKITKEKIKHGS